MLSLAALRKNPPIAQLIGIVMLAWALLTDHPYGFFVLLRWVLCGVFVFLAGSAFQAKKMGWAVALGIAAGVYNPFIRVHLNRESWSEINIATIVLLVASVWVLNRK